jgi:hypothetical protein
MSRSKYEPVSDGDWMHLGHDGMSLACCDCSLVHDIDVKIVASRTGRRKIFLRVKRNERSTAAMRRPYKFAKDE